MSIDFTDTPHSRVQALLGMAAILRSGLDNPRYAYLPVNPRLPGVLEFSAATGAQHVSALDLEIGGVAIECHVIDYGPGGLIAAQRDVVYAELGLTPAQTAGPAARSTPMPCVRPCATSGSRTSWPRASWRAGEGPEERAASVRRRLDQAAERAFGEGEDERLLRAVLVRGYLDPSSSLEAAAGQMHMSRSSFFRHLKRAVERVAEYLRSHPA